MVYDRVKFMFWGNISNCRERRTPMIRILICDDDLLFLQCLQTEVQKILSEAGMKAKVHTYSSKEEIGHSILSSCDIAFLDIDFMQKKYTGIDIAKELRQLRKDTIIIFVTNYIEYAPDGYEVQAFRYVLKNELSKKLSSYLNLAIEQLNIASETFKIQINGELIDIPISNILYFEAQQHTVSVHIQKNNQQIKTYRFYSTLSSLEAQMEPHGFLRTHKSYLVNMNHIQKYQCHEAVLSNGVVLRVSEKNYAQQKEKYLLWKGR